MASAHYRFLARQSLLSRSQGERVVEALEGRFAWSSLDVMERAAYDGAQREAAAAVERRTVSRRSEDFMLLYFERNARVVERLMGPGTKCRVPQAAARLLALCFLLMREEDGEVIAPREHLLFRLGVSERTLQLALKALLDVGALTRRRDPEPGRQGRGFSRYFVNPRLATHLVEPYRSAAQASAPEVGNVVALDGVRRPSERRSRAPSFVPVVL